MRNRNAWVVDACVVAKWYLRDEDLVEEADEIRRGPLRGGDALWAPHVVRHEVANTLSAACRSGRISRGQAEHDIAHFLRSELGRQPDEDAVITEAANKTIDLSIYINDAVYISMAETLEIEFVTSDRKLYDAVRAQLPFVRWLGDI